MARYAEWYAVELDGYLKGRLSDVQRFEATREITNHFAEHVEDLVSKGMNESDAEKAAVKAFGHPRTAAINLLRESKGPIVGKLLSVVGCVGMAVILPVLGMAYQQFFLKQDHGGWGYLYLPLLLGSFLATTLGLILGTILSRKVPYGLMTIAWCIGISALVGNYYLKRDEPFAQVPIDRFESTLAAWTKEQQQAFAFGNSVQRIYKQCETNYWDGPKAKLLHPEEAVKAVTEEGPKLVASKSVVIAVGGSLTSGFVGPLDPENPYHTGSGEELHTGELGNLFPIRHTYHLGYYKTADEAVKAWSKASQNDSGFSMLSRDAGEQEQFISDAIRINRMTSAELFVRTLGPFVGISFGVMVGMMLIGFGLVRIPNLTVYSSFRRRIA